MKLKLWIGGETVGELAHDGLSDKYSFSYSPEWIQSPHAFALSPHLPLDGRFLPPARESVTVHDFFRNLLPEGEGLEAAALVNRVSKSNTIALLLAMGRETAGSLRFTLSDNPPSLAASPLRPISIAELSQRIGARPDVTFSVWDSKVRMAIAGFQDKLSVYEHSGQWHLIDDYAHSTTEILKPEPSSPKMSGMTTNELMCMRLAPAIGLPAAEVRLIHIPAPVLGIRRFDRVVEVSGDGRHVVRRVYCIDGCQALDLSPDFKYERPYGDGEHVRTIRLGASMRRFFEFLGNDSRVMAKASARMTFLRWAIFQILIGNTDAHAKNVSFFCGPNGIKLTPTYDLVCTLAYDNAADSLAMAIGDNFDPRAIKAYDWALFAYETGLNPNVVSRELLRTSNAVASRVSKVAQQVVAEGGDADMVSRVVGVIKQQCDAVQRCAAEVPKIERHHFE